MRLARNARPLRTFSSVSAAIRFMSGGGRAYPTVIRSAGFRGLFDASDNASRSNKKQVAATAIQSAFRGWRARRNV